jgi:hypothetical protein
MLTNDTPIVTPENDQFGVDPFARALAKALSEMPSPEGVVVAVNGPWGVDENDEVSPMRAPETNIATSARLVRSQMGDGLTLNPGSSSHPTRRWRKADSNRWSHLRQRC